MPETSTPPPISARRAAVAWLVALPVFMAGAWYLARRFYVPGEMTDLALVAVQLACLSAYGIVLGTRSPRAFRHRDFLRLAPFLSLVAPLPIAVHMPRHDGFWPVALTAGTFGSAVYALGVAFARSPEAGYRPVRRLALWSGLWAPLDPRVARTTPISWTHALRSWLLLWPVSIAICLPSPTPTHVQLLTTLVAPILALGMATFGLAGTSDRRRCRHWGWAFVVDLVAWGALVVIMCAGYLNFGSTPVVLAWSVLVSTAALALMVVVTHRPLRTRPDDTVPAVR